MTRQVDYPLAIVEPYINWLYFDHAWGMSGKPVHERQRLREEALALLGEMEGRYQTHAVFALCKAHADGDDLLVDGVRIPMLRQQAAGGEHLCLADFVRPLSLGGSDRVGIFMATVDAAMEADYRGDDYLRMLSQTLADRLAEATAERLHEEVRKHYWGYAPDERLTPRQLHAEQYQGIRPAVGYPSLPDVSINFLLADMLQAGRIGIRLTGHGMMTPHASVSGLMLAHPKARYFSIGKIGEDQLRDYAHRRGIPVELARRFLNM